MLQPFKHTAFSRAMEEDPNMGRCSIENFPKHRGVRPMHVLPRAVTGMERVMSSLEYSWNLRHGTLNLDTRRNILFVGQSLATMYDRGCWVLLPEESVMDQFVDSLGMALGRAKFPVLSPPFNYTFVPVHGMDDVGVVRQDECPPTSGASFTNHVYPFKTLPLIQSHVQPEFAIVALGKVLYTPSVMTKSLRQKLFAEFPAAKKVYELYRSWTSKASTPAALEARLKNKSYAPLSKDEVDDLASESDGDSVATTPRRIEEKRPKGRPQNPTKRARSASPNDCSLTKKLRELEGTGEAILPSFHDKVSAWALESRYADETPQPSAYVKGVASLE